MNIYPDPLAVPCEVRCDVPCPCHHSVCLSTQPNTQRATSYHNVVRTANYQWPSHNSLDQSASEPKLLQVCISGPEANRRPARHPTGPSSVICTAVSVCLWTLPWQARISEVVAPQCNTNCCTQSELFVEGTPLTNLFYQLPCVVKTYISVRSLPKSIVPFILFNLLFARYPKRKLETQQSPHLNKEGQHTVRDSFFGFSRVCPVYRQSSRCHWFSSSVARQ